MKELTDRDVMSHSSTIRQLLRSVVPQVIFL